VREAEKIERFRPPLAAPGSIPGGVPPELDQSRLLRMQLQTKLREPVTQISQEPLGVLTMLKARHIVISEPRKDDISSRVTLAPLVGPQVKHVVE